MNRLIAYELGHPRHDIQPGRRRREWMDATPGGFANRCLPLTIANMHGWEIRCRSSFDVVWDGSDGLDGLTILPIAQGAGDLLPVSHFGSGVLTFHVNFLFRTDPGISLAMMGPPNMPKHGISPLFGLVETDWSSMTATMNWRLTAPNCPVRFEVGEPFCFVFPVQRTLVEDTEPVFRPIKSDPPTASRFAQWTQERMAFNAGLRSPGSDAVERGWMRDYHRGDASAVEHRTKLRLRPFVDDDAAGLGGLTR
jgi:hypothetical protein